MFLKWMPHEGPVSHDSCISRIAFPEIVLVLCTKLASYGAPLAKKRTKKWPWHRTKSRPFCTKSVSFSRIVWAIIQSRCWPYIHDISAVVAYLTFLRNCYKSFPLPSIPVHMDLTTSYVRSPLNVFRTVYTQLCHYIANDIFGVFPINEFYHFVNIRSLKVSQL